MAPPLFRQPLQTAGCWHGSVHSDGSARLVLIVGFDPATFCDVDRWSVCCLLSRIRRTLAVKGLKFLFRLGHSEKTITYFPRLLRQTASIDKTLGPKY